MHRTDSPWLPLDAGSDFFSGLSNPSGHLPQCEQPSAANSCLCGDLGESYWPDWENAWIDLGGEG